MNERKRDDKYSTSFVQDAVLLYIHSGPAGNDHVPRFCLGQIILERKLAQLRE